MGSSTYNFSSRTKRASSMGYDTKSADEIFIQNKKRKIHESMDPKTIKIREARDSQTHPMTVPIILALDLTGSMGHIPHSLIKDGLPKLMSGMLEKGLNDPSLLFLGIGDTEADNYPLQVGQFESGDAELDTWLTRTYIEGGGGGNAGESYLLAWYFASRHTVTDAWEKRNQKGFLFTIGDEPCLKTLPKNILSELMTESKEESTLSFDSLLKDAQERYNVFHLHVMEGSAGNRSYDFWKNLLGQNCVKVETHMDIPKIIAEIVVSHSNSILETTKPTINSLKIEEEEIL